MEFWIQKSKLENNTKVGLHFQATTDWHFKCYFFNEPIPLQGLCRAPWCMNKGQRAGRAGGAAAGAGAQGWGGGEDPPGSLQQEGVWSPTGCGAKRPVLSLGLCCGPASRAELILPLRPEPVCISKTEFCCPSPEFLQRWVQSQSAIRDMWGRGTVWQKERERWAMGPMGKDEKVIWDVPKGCSEKCVF